MNATKTTTKRTHAKIHSLRNEHGTLVVIVQTTQGESFMLDADDWPRVSELYGELWCAIQNGHGRLYVAAMKTHNRAGERRLLTLQRAILGAKRGDVIGFRNRDTMDLTRKNLYFKRKAGTTKEEVYQTVDKADSHNLPLTFQ